MQQKSSDLPVPGIEPGSRRKLTLDESDGC
jgi:hypothetical protein